MKPEIEHLVDPRRVDWLREGVADVLPGRFLLYAFRLGHSVGILCAADRPAVTAWFTVAASQFDKETRRALRVAGRKLAARMYAPPE